jgi:hypothetical protein
MFVSVSMTFDWMFELFRQCGIILFVSVSVIFDWMFEVFRQCGILLFVSVSVIFIETETNSMIPHCRNSSNIQSNIIETETNSNLPQCREQLQHPIKNHRNRDKQYILLFVSVSMIFDWMLELFRQCGILLFVSVSMIFDWMLEVFRQCDILHCRNSSNIQSKIIETETNSNLPQCREQLQHPIKNHIVLLILDKFSLIIFFKEKK